MEIILKTVAGIACFAFCYLLYSYNKKSAQKHIAAFNVITQEKKAYEASLNIM